MSVSLPSVRLLYRPEPENPAAGELLFWSPDGDPEPAVRSALGEGLPPLAPRAAGVAIPIPSPTAGSPDWRIRRVEGRGLGLWPGVPLLARVAATPSPGQPAPGDSVRAWSVAAKFALELVAGGRMVPTLRHGSPGGSPTATWAVSLARPEDRERFVRLADALPPSAHAFPSEGAGNGNGVRLRSPEEVLRAFLDGAADALVRVAARRSADELKALPETPGWAGRFLQSLVGDDSRFATEAATERAIVSEVSGWVRGALGAGAEAPFRVLFQLETPAEGAPEEAPWILRYAIQSTEDPKATAVLSDVWAGRIADEGLREVLEADPAAAHDGILRALGEASRAFRPIEASLRRPKPAYVVLGPGGAWLFLSEAAPLLRAAGHAVAIPAEFGPEGSRRLRARLRVSGTGRDSWRTRAAGEDGTGLPSWDAPAEFRWEVAVGNDPITAAEFRALARGKRPLLHWRGKWVLVDPGDLATIARLVSQRATGSGSLAEALALALRGGVAPAPGLAEAPVVAGGALGDLVQALRSGGFGATEEPPGFRGKLRPYQKRGVAWLDGMARIGLGTLLADDMGLGKTIQVLAFLLGQREQKPDEKRGSLLVCPTSVLGNWQREAERFAPPLPVVRHHGPGRPKDPEALEKWVPAGGLVLTTYATARGDVELLSSYDWAHVILDEAQNVKNPATAQARAVRRFPAPSRIALTGTPVENRLQDLWMLLQFANPGFLGPLAEFRHAFAKPIERYRDPEAAARLRRLTGPFVLRRLKSEVEADLPEKIEGTVACSLTREQATLYKQALERQWGGISGSSGMERRGRVLALLTHLKQICNHPAHFMKEAGDIRGRSGKLQRLTEMLEEAISTGDRSLIFTQYVEMGELLAPYLVETFKIEAPFLHGSLTGPARDALVKRFQEDPNGPPVLLVSLRAGGTGLNLTRATHVFHYDRWWNPAVEDQATDRTHRIGQTRAVHVHKLVTIGTLEEKISEMLEKKRGLADAIVGTGEGWLTELSDEQLRDLVELGGDVVVGAEES